MSLIEEDTVPIIINSQNSTVQTRVYLRRWYILAVFSILGVLQGMIWNSFGPISTSLLAVLCPYWTNATLALLGNWGNIMYIIPVVPVLWFFETKGLRASMILTATLMLIGTALRTLPLGIPTFTWMCHICAICNGMAGIIVFSAPSAVSSAWFPPNERTTATGIALVFNNLGNAFSFLAAPGIVPDPTAINQTAPFNDANFPGFATNVSNGCPILEPAEKLHIEKRLQILMYLEAGLVLGCFVAIIAHFPSKPKNPPSVSSSMERMAFLPGLRSFLKNYKAIILTLAYSLFNGVIASWYSVMNITFKPLPLGSPEDTDKIIGYIGICSIAGNCVASILVSRIVDSLKGKMKRTLSIIMVLGFGCWVWMCLICLKVIPFSLPQLYASTILASSLTYSASPIFFEFCVEIAYPVPEGIVGGFLTCFYNICGMIFLFLFYIPNISKYPQWIPYAIIGSTGVSLPLVALVKEEYNRSAFDSEDTTPENEVYQDIIDDENVENS